MCKLFISDRYEVERLESPYRWVIRRQGCEIEYKSASIISEYITDNKVFNSLAFIDEWGKIHHDISESLSEIEWVSDWVSEVVEKEKL